MSHEEIGSRDEVEGNFKVVCAVMSWKKALRLCGKVHKRGLLSHVCFSEKHFAGDFLLYGNETTDNGYLAVASGL
jgi:hypothetical protein